MMNELQWKIFSATCKSLDNCPLQPNQYQEDSNTNWIGNQCEWYSYNTWTGNNTTNNWTWSNSNSWTLLNDSDGDGISDTQDQCPQLQETYNGYQDSDGCPELWNNNPCTTQVLWDSFVGFECLQCPCQYIQEDSDLNPWDIIRATLRNISGTILQSRSNIKTL
jgi:hypothetical protein